MYEVGDLILSGILVGVVIQCGGDKVRCSCSDYTEHEFSAQECTLIMKSCDVIKQFEGSIRNANR